MTKTTAIYNNQFSWFSVDQDLLKIEETKHNNLHDASWNCDSLWIWKKNKVCSYHCSIADISATEHMTAKDSNTIPFEWDKKRYLIS